LFANLSSRSTISLAIFSTSAGAKLASMPTCSRSKVIASPTSILSGTHSRTYCPAQKLLRLGVLTGNDNIPSWSSRNDLLDIPADVVGIINDNQPFLIRFVSRPRATEERSRSPASPSAPALALAESFCPPAVEAPRRTARNLHAPFRRLSASIQRIGPYRSRWSLTNRSASCVFLTPPSPYMTRACGRLLFLVTRSFSSMPAESSFRAV
jgi:hypothetical protein